MTTEEQLKEISRRVEKIEDRLDEQTERMFKNREELKDIIREAVSEANDKLLGKINNHEERIIVLEKQDGEKAKAIIKSIFATSLSWLVLGILANLPTIIGAVSK